MVMSGFIYEVHMQVHPQVYDRYMLWLKTHRKEILELGCFTGSELHKNIEIANDHHVLRVLYFYNRAEDFKKYLDCYAEKMRSELSEEIKKHIIFTRSNYQRL